MIIGDALASVTDLSATGLGRRAVLIKDDISE
jgi:hypothetical protein